MFRKHKEKTTVACLCLLICGVLLANIFAMIGIGDWILKCVDYNVIGTICVAIGMVIEYAVFVSVFTAVVDYIIIHKTEEK